MFPTVPIHLETCTLLGKDLDQGWWRGRRGPRAVVLTVAEA